LSEARKIAAMAEAWHLPVAPHDCTGPVVLAASTHLSLNAPNALVQESVRAFYRTWYRDLVTALPEVGWHDHRSPRPRAGDWNCTPISTAPIRCRGRYRTVQRSDLEELPMIDLPPEGLFLGRVWRAGIGPALVAVRDGHVADITTRAAPTMRDLLEQPDITGFVAAIPGEDLGPLEAIAAASVEAEGDVTCLLAPCDLQAVKACGVTFARSMVERVIEERAAGDPARAEEIRARVANVIGDSLRDLVPGSDKAAEVKRLLQAEGLWSQYLEVGIGPDAEVFTKAQPMSAVGWGAAVGLHPISTWNNPEPEVVLAWTAPAASSARHWATT
jgi:hypothetical protein